MCARGGVCCGGERGVFLPVSMSPSLPGTVGTPAFFIVSLAVDLSPIRVMDSGSGPMNFRPWSLHMLTKEAFSERKPYPGCMASAPCPMAAARMLGTLR